VSEEKIPLESYHDPIHWPATSIKLRACLRCRGAMEYNAGTEPTCVNCGYVLYEREPEVDKRFQDIEEGSKQRLR